jgi:exodeoxyribonuclease V alpha subunit
VLVRRNDPVLRLYNGDIGIALPDAASGQMLVVFPDARAGWRALAPARLPEHETAFALTVHQSQGSEFDAVAVVLPTEPGPVLTRELLYTAITRARERVTLVGSAPVLAAAVAARTRRRSGLASRLAELAASGPPPG